MKQTLAIDFIRNNNLTGIKAGFERPDFLNIWMVIVDNRIFARSWGFAEKSWYNSFLHNPAGELNCGGQVFTIKAVIPNDLDKLTEKINAAYLEKYNSGANSVYAQGIVTEEHVRKTMEFIVTEE